MSESSARHSGNPFDKEVRDTHRLKGLSSLEEQDAVAADIETLRRDGYLILEGLLTADKVAEITADMERIHDTTALGRKARPSSNMGRTSALPAATSTSATWSMSTTCSSICRSANSSFRPR